MANHITNGKLYRDGLDLLLKDASACLGSRDHDYWLSYMHFITLEGESVSTNKFRLPGSRALTPELAGNLEAFKHRKEGHNHNDRNGSTH